MACPIKAWRSLGAPYDRGLRTQFLVAVALLIASCLMLPGCSKKPSASDVQEFLRAQQPQGAPYSVETVQVSSEKSDNGNELVKFKALVRMKEPLFRQVDTIEELRTSGWDDAAFAQAAASISALPEDLARKVIEVHSGAAQLPTLVQQVVPEGETRTWYGTVQANYLVDKWSFEHLAFTEKPEFPGEPKGRFGSQSFVQGTPEAHQALEGAKKARAAFVDAVATNVQLAGERRSREEAERKVEQLNLARAQADAADQAARRRLPVQLSLRQATLNPGHKVLLIKNSSGARLSVDMFVSDGRLQKRLQFEVPVDRPLEVGWLQGWSFKPGDDVTLQNVSFDPVRFRIR